MDKEKPLNIRSRTKFDFTRLDEAALVKGYVYSLIIGDDEDVGPVYADMIFLMEEKGTDYFQVTPKKYLFMKLGNLDLEYFAGGVMSAPSGWKFKSTTLDIVGQEG